MPSWIVLLRAVNVGQRKLRMEHARQVLEGAGFLDVASHIQTGNLLVSTGMRSAATVETAVGECLEAAAGFDIAVMARRPEQVSSLVLSVDGTPPVLDGETNRYVAFCKEEPGDAARARLEGWESDGERAWVVGQDVVVEIAKSFHEARLGNAQVERIVGGPATMRNITVVRTLAQRWGQ